MKGRRWQSEDASHNCKVRREKCVIPDAANRVVTVVSRRCTKDVVEPSYGILLPQSPLVI